MSQLTDDVRDVVSLVESRLGTEAWVTAYEWTVASDLSHHELNWCWLISPSDAEAALQRPDAGHEPEFGAPGFITYPGDQVSDYFRYGDDTRDEPLAIRRDYHGLEPETLDVSQEFCLYHNLYRGSNGDYTKFDEAGNGEPVVRNDNNRILIRTRELKQYLAAKTMVLVAHFDYERYYDGPITAHDVSPTDVLKRTTDTVTRVEVRQSRLDSQRTITSVYGNKILHGVALDQCGEYPYEPAWQHESFEVGIDESGQPILQEADSDNLSIPEFLIPVFFTRDVLGKYQNNPDKYTISDGFMACAGLWSLRLDNDRSDYVVVLLGDLGRLPHSEQLYWRSFNVPPDGTLSDTAFTRGVLGWFSDSTIPDLVFKREFETFQQQWLHRYGWDLFRPLPPGDQHYYGALGIPLTDSQREFDAQIGGLTKVLVDSLNDKELWSRIKAREDDMKSIRKLEVFLQESGTSGYEPHIEFLCQLQDIRSHGVAHIKGDSYDKDLARLCASGSDHRSMFGTVLSEATDLIYFLQAALPGTDTKA
jgi:hypothetical protein